MGQWAMRADGSWSWDRTPADPSVTRIMSAYAGGSPMPEHVSRDVYDPDLGSDGGGRYAEPDPIPTIDPDDPVDHVDQLRDPTVYPDTEYGRGAYATEPALTQVGTPPAWGRDPQTWAAPSADLVCCPTCGTGVHPDRLRD